MSIYATILAYFYAIALSLWSVAIPQVNLFQFTAQNTEFGNVPEKLVHFDPPDNLYGFITNSNSFSLGFRGDHSQYVEDYSHVNFFKYQNLKRIFATAFSFSSAVEVKFRFIDLIYPFHYFW